MTRNRSKRSLIGRIFHHILVVAGALSLTAMFFLVLPLIQAIHRPPQSDTLVRAMDVGNIPPPPPPPEAEPEKEEEPEEQPPELEEEMPKIDLAALELALNPGFGDGFPSGDFAMNIGNAANEQDDVDALFSMSDLDQKPRVIYQPSPNIDAKVRKKAPGTVYVLFIVDERGRVENPIVQSASDPIFERPALAAVKQWRFDPGQRNGQPVRFRMRVPITFPK